MITHKKSEEAGNRKRTLMLREKSVFRSALLFIVLIALLVSACGGTANQPKTAGYYLELGEDYLLDSRYKQAVVAFQKAIELDPNNVPARIGMAKAYIGLGIPDKTQSLLHEVAALDPDNKEATGLLVKLLKDDISRLPSGEPNTMPSLVALPDAKTVNTSGDTIYIVKKGDSLWSIAVDFYGGKRVTERLVGKLVRYNGIDGSIYIGKELKLPPIETLSEMDD